jgi:transcription elongation factor Elf1
VRDGPTRRMSGSVFGVALDFHSLNVRRGGRLQVQAREGETMPYVKCPSCGERGKIGATLIGARIKCKVCGVSFQVAPPPAKATVTAGLVSDFPSSSVEKAGGIEVEGLDASAWTLSTETGVSLKAVATAEPEPQTATSPTVIATDSSAGVREYRVLTPKDKYFDGKFDLARLEEALNHYGRKGWTVKSMSTPHIKNFSGVLEETIVVLLER